MAASELYERVVVGAEIMLGKEGFRKLLDDHFGGKIPQQGTGAFAQLVFAFTQAPFDYWLRTYRKQSFESMQLKPPTLPRFPKELENADHFMPYESKRPTTPEPFWIGFRSKGEANPYEHPGNVQAWENGRALARTAKAEIYRKYVDECRKIVQRAWGEGVRVP